MQAHQCWNRQQYDEKVNSDTHAGIHICDICWSAPASNAAIPEASKWYAMYYRYTNNPESVERENDDSNVAYRS